MSANETEAAVVAVIEHISAAHPGDESTVLAQLLLSVLARFLGEGGPGADNLAAALNARLAGLPGERIWQIGLIPRAALDDIQRAIAEALAGPTRH